MKWMTIVVTAVMLSACGFATTDVVEYQEVVVAPPISTVTVYDSYYQPVPIDVTTTTVDYY